MGWSCGYKNIQMQISHLLQRDEVMRLQLPLCIYPACVQEHIPLQWLHDTVLHCVAVIVPLELCSTATSICMIRRSLMQAVDMLICYLHADLIHQC